MSVDVANPQAVIAEANRRQKLRAEGKPFDTFDQPDHRTFETRRVQLEAAERNVSARRTVPDASVSARYEGDILTLYLPEPPSANRWWRFVRNRMIVSKAARGYKARITLALTALRIQPIPTPTPVSVRIFWYRGRKMGDLDKRVGVLLDALQGTAFDSDAQVTHLEAYRYDRANAHRVVVHVCARLAAHGIITELQP